MSLLKILAGLSWVVIGFYVLQGSFWLMTYPSDFTFLGGILSVFLYGFVTFKMIQYAVRKFFKENNEPR